MNSFPATEFINDDCERMDKPAQSSGVSERIDCTINARAELQLIDGVLPEGIFQSKDTRKFAYHHRAEARQEKIEMSLAKENHRTRK